VILAAGVGFAAGAFTAAHRLAAGHAAQSTQREAACQAERTALEAALEEGQARAQSGRPWPTRPSASVPAVPTRPSPADIIVKLVALRSAPPSSTRTARQRPLPLSFNSLVASVGSGLYQSDSQ
jgi:hypothetical protein